MFLINIWSLRARFVVFCLSDLTLYDKMCKGVCVKIIKAIMRAEKNKTTTLTFLHNSS